MNCKQKSIERVNFIINMQYTLCSLSRLPPLKRHLVNIVYVEQI